MRSDREFPLLTRRISRRSFAAGTLATGGLLIAGLSRADTVAAASFGPGDQVVTTDYTNYRDAPGLNSNVLLVLPPNQIAVVQDSGTAKDGYTWYLIRIATGGDNPTGYVAGALLASNSGGGGDFPVGSQIIVNTDALNVRDQPNGSVINVVNSGAIGDVTGAGVSAGGYTWIKVAFPKLEGWVATDFVKAYSGGGGGGAFKPGDGVLTTSAVNYRDAPGLNSNVYVVLPAGSYAVVQDSGTAKDGYTWYLVRTSTGGPSPTGYLAGEFLQLGSPSGGNFNIGDSVYVNSGPLNFRSAPGLNGSILRTLQTGDTGKVTDGPQTADGYTWYKIEVITGEQGWVVQDFLSAGNPTPPPNGSVKVGDTIKVVDGPLNIRSSAGSKSPVIDVAATGAIAKVVDGPLYAQDYTWIKINGNLLAVGWVAFEFCQVV
jgi:hypothetical protein